MNIKRYFMKKLLNLFQKLVDYAYKKEGLTDRVLERQLQINMLRNKHNAPDPKMLNDDGYCQ